MTMMEVDADGRTVVGLEELDEIETTYWDAIRIFREEEDQGLEDEHRKRSEDTLLKAATVQEEQTRLIEERLNLLQRLHEIDQLLPKLEGDSNFLAAKARTLDHDVEVARISLSQERAAQDEMRREYFYNFRQEAQARENARAKHVSVVINDQPMPDAPLAQPEQRPLVQPEQRPMAQPEQRPMAQPEHRPMAQPESQPETQPEPQREPQPEPQPELRPEPRPEAKHQPERHSESQPEAERQPQTQPSGAERQPAQRAPQLATHLDLDDNFGGVEVIGEPGETVPNRDAESSLSELSTPLSESQLQFELQVSQEPDEPEQTEKPPTTGGFTAVNARPSAQTAKPGNEEIGTGDAGPSETKGAAKPKPTARRSVPGGKTPARGSDTPAIQTPVSGSPAPDMTLDDDEAQDLPEIDRKVLALRDDGTVFTDPPCMRGVPLVKISPNHPYWEPDWQSIEDIIEPQLQKWKDKYTEHVAKGSSNSTKFLANRQINRGNAILAFLKQGEFHPYQLVGKQYIKPNFVNYDTIFRMVQILDELPKFNLDITPSQWLRHRLYEVIEEEGDQFSLGKTVHELYHDPKVTALRAKCGFGNIGRPSGYKAEKKDPDSQKKPRPSRKRKEQHSTPKSTPKQGAGQDAEEEKKPAVEKSPVVKPPPTAKAAVTKPDAVKSDVSEPGSSTRPRSSRRETRTAMSSGHQPQQQPQSQSASQGSGREEKRRRTEQTPKSHPSPEDMEYDGYTSSDSYSGDRVHPVDWRVQLVKHQGVSTNEKVTQYWHWVNKGDGGNGNEGDMFEHQVLKDVSPHNVSWGVYKNTIDFHLRLPELREVIYAVGAKRIIISLKVMKGVTYRGDLLAEFKRDRTKRRFLSFMKEKRIPVIKTTTEYIEEAWRNMQPEVLPAM